MATLVLAAAGQAVGSLFGPIGAIVGKAAGALAGYAIDQRLFSDTTTRTVGRIDDLSVQTASEGNPIARVYGRVRLAGTVIWSTDFVEHVDTDHVGGKGGGGSTVKEYSYTVSFAVGIAEGPIARVGRIWADGEPLDLNGLEVRTYLGGEDQAPDPLIEATEGVAPAYRGLAYVVFQDLPVGPFGNRLPQLTFEVLRPVGELETQIRAVTLIPAATEFGYDPQPVKIAIGPGEAVGDNLHIGVAASDFDASLDELMAVCPNLERVALVVAWFGTDLRAGHCQVLPKVERRDRPTDVPWSVAGEDRDSAEVVSGTTDEDGTVRPNYGGTPSDGSVFRAIAALKARGLKVTFYPFLMMDVPPGNGLSDPYGGAEQAAFPWRGRITLEQAPGSPGSPDGTAAADAQVAAFLGTALPGQFGGAGGEVAYGGPAQWTFRRMVLHYAELVRQAGGVDAFLVGSELRGLTTARGASGYPFVAGLVRLLADVRSLLGPGVRLSYAADWSEYFGHQTGGEVRFHLDPLWASPNVDFIGIDNYWPLSDWRDGGHLDAGRAVDIYDPAYLAANVAGGEGYDWYYASAEDRANQVRTPITDGAYGKPWVYRYKDLATWWRSLHYDRVGGVERTQPTAWRPGMKPVWFTEVGCPAVDRGANQPNVFFDPKSAESALPYFSSGRRDDQMQRSHLGALLGAFDPAVGPDVARVNPVSAVYGGRMVDPATSHVWTWDARPWPAFPQLTDVWADGDNWERGHWLNGRLGGVPFRELVAALFADWELEAPPVEGVPVVLDGFLVSGPTSLRAVLEPLLAAVSAVAADTGTEIRFVGYGGPSVATIGEDDVVDTGREPLIEETRDEAQNLPIEVRLRYLDSGNEFQVASARYRPPAGSSRQVETIQVSAALNDGLATELCEVALTVRLEGRTTLKFALPPSRLPLTPGDVITLRRDGILRDLLIEEVSDVLYREVSARTVDRDKLAPTPTPGSPTPPIVPPTLAPPVAYGLNLPRVDEMVADHLPYLAVYADPFPVMGVWRAVPDGNFQLIRTVERPSTAGEVVRSPGDGPTSRWDYGGRIDVRLYRGRATSAPPQDVLAGANALAVRAQDGLWEVLSYQNATLIGEETYRLDVLLRGRLGTNDAVDRGILAGAPLVLLDGTLSTIPLSIDDLRLRRTYRVGPLSEGIGGRNVTTFDFVATGRGLTPWSPVHGEALLVSGGAIRISWIRRTRIGGDSWGPGDVPLGETAEQYRLEIRSGAATVRTVTTTIPQYSYALAEQTADFGSAQRRISFRVAQIAPGFGAGAPYEVTVDVKQP